MTLNTDGSVLRNGNWAAAGGLLRDECGRCHDTFTINLGACSITRAEMHGLLTGLRQAWQLCRKSFRCIQPYHSGNTITSNILDQLICV
ncbi:Putative ribonuclease H protein At1g65750 [Linum grandiflorum]